MLHLLTAPASSTALATPEGGTITFGQLREAVAQRCEFWRSAAGLDAGQAAALASPNSTDMAIEMLALMTVAAAAPLNPAYTPRELDFYTRDLGVRALAAPAAGPVRRLPDPACYSRDTALLLHTSGTTAHPKLVALSRDQLECAARAVAHSLALTPADTSVLVMPLFHVHGLIAGLLAPLSAGACVVIPASFQAEKVCFWLAYSGATWFTAVPSLHRAILQRGKARFPKLRFVRSCSAALQSALWDSLEAAFDCPVLQAYGMTEAAHQISITPIDARVRGSVGKSTGPEIAVRNGEVLLRGATVITAYAKGGEEAFEDGWLKTGDLGRLDERGFVSLTGRAKEIVNCAGEKVSPAEVDAVLCSHPAVEAALSFGVGDTARGEEIAAAVVLRDRGPLDAHELRDYARERLARFKVPRRIVFVDSLPLGPTGKPQRAGMAERLGIE